MSYLCRGHTNFCIIPTLVYVLQLPKLRILRWGSDPGTIEWVQYNHKDHHRKKAGGSGGEKIKMGEKVRGSAWPQAKEYGGL